jgi:hypothetical protein
MQGRDVQTVGAEGEGGMNHPELSDEQLLKVCEEYVRIRDKQDPCPTHGPPAMHLQVAKVMSAWLRAFSAVIDP